MAVSAAGVALLATMDTGTGPFTAGCFMAVLGFGAGLSQQVVVLIAQNAAPPGDIGAARLRGVRDPHARDGRRDGGLRLHRVPEVRRGGRPARPGRAGARLRRRRPPRGARHAPRPGQGRCRRGVRGRLLHAVRRGAARPRRRSRRGAAAQARPLAPRGPAKPAKD
ncbi:hypothetical protein LUX57_05765 [Actinomadura madurae]|uniref:hypothetical protein n=1 Tax=Actinomadura madurae TaxID=1993 RepID=UPI0020D25B55|nr:hypothetical protein [Actinomadura madurae]MCP9964714.1 hypothetical protein [Actinomadura madurae]